MGPAFIYSMVVELCGRDEKRTCIHASKYCPLLLKIMMLESASKDPASQYEDYQQVMNGAMVDRRDKKSH